MFVIRLLAVDPSSTCTGYAVFGGSLAAEVPGELIDAGCVRAVAARRKTPFERVREMAADLREIVVEHEPAVAIVEIPSGKVHRRIAGNNPSGLSVYGFAAGWIAADLEHKMRSIDGCLEQPLRVVDELTWTAGVSKGRRQTFVELQFPSYRAAGDAGADAADAIALGCWLIDDMIKRRACGETTTTV